MNHIVAIHQKKVERLPSGNRNFSVHSQANAEKYEQLGYSVVVHYGCVSCKETFAEKEELRKHCDLNHVNSICAPCTSHAKVDFECIDGYSSTDQGNVVFYGQIALMCVRFKMI